MSRRGGRELPENHDGGEKFNGTVATKRKEGRAFGAPSRGKRKSSFQCYPSDGDRLNSPDAGQDVHARSMRDRYHVPIIAVTTEWKRVQCEAMPRRVVLCVNRTVRRSAAP